METVRIRDQGWKEVGSGIRDRHPGSATLDLTEWLDRLTACANVATVLGSIPASSDTRPKQC